MLCSIFVHSRDIAMGVADATWHHVCVTWEQYYGLLDLYKDGERKYVYQSNGFRSSSAQNVGIEGAVISYKSVIRDFKYRERMSIVIFII